MKITKYAVLLFFFIPFFLAAENLPPWFTVLRDGVYEQNLTADELVPVYREALKEARSRLTGQDLYIMNSRCEYMMGRAYQYEERKNEAAGCYDRGMDWARKALDISPTAPGWQMLAENQSQACVVKSTGYAMANGLKVGTYAKNALELDPRNTACQYMLAARYAYAPAPFHNHRKGIQMLEDIISGYSAYMEKDDQFNVYSALGYVYIQQKKAPEARPWLEKALTVYPTNKYVQGLLRDLG